jgi:hypothetical protein
VLDVDQRTLRIVAEGDFLRTFPEDRLDEGADLRVVVGD